MIRQVSRFVIATALIATSFGVRAAVTHAHVTTGPGIAPLQLMVNAKGLPTTKFVDYTFVFN